MLSPPLRYIKQDQIAIVRFSSEDVICMETFKDYPQLGRFTLRDEGRIVYCTGFLRQNVIMFPSFPFLGKTIAIGKVLKLVE